VIERHGDRDGVARTSATPTPTTSAGMTLRWHAAALARHPNLFSASTVDQMPARSRPAIVFGSPPTVPVPDLDRTDYLLILGANPYASNGSLCTAPDFPGRIEAIRARGGKYRRRRPAPEPDGRGGRRVAHGDPARHRRAVPGRDHAGDRTRGTGLASPGMSAARIAGSTRCSRCSRRSPPRRSPTPPGSSARQTIRRLARARRAPTAAVYGRIGTTTTEFGTLASWLIDVVNLVTGNLDRRRWRDVPEAGAGRRPPKPGPGGGFGHGVGAPPGVASRPAEVMGEYPVAALAEEIDHPGRGPGAGPDHDRGNPVLSTRTPNASTQRSASSSSWCVDIYVNETTRHADVILPSPSRAAEGALRPAAAAVRGPQRGELLAARPAARTRSARRVGDPGQAGVDRAGAAARHRGVDGRRPRDRAMVGAAVRDEHSADPRARRGRDRRRAVARRPTGSRADARPHVADRSLRGGVRRRADRRGEPRPAAGEPARGGLRCTRAADPRGAADAVRAGRARPPGAARRPRPSGADAVDDLTQRDSCSSAAVTCAATTRGCTTSRCW
jgi:hypothetical protein